MKINYKSDFDFYLVLRVGTEKSYRRLGWPKHPMSVKLYQGSVDSGRTVATASIDEEGTAVNMANDGGKMHVWCDNPGKMSKGAVNCELQANIANAHYPDGVRSVMSQHKSVLEFVDGVGDDGMPWDVVLYLPEAYLDLADADDPVSEPEPTMEERLEALESRVEQLENEQ